VTRIKPPDGGTMLRLMPCGKRLIGSGRLASGRGADQPLGTGAT